MSFARHSRLTIPLIALAVVLLALPSAAQIKFRGRYLTGGGGTIDPVLTVNIEVLGYSTREEIVELAKAINEQGEAAFHAAFRAMKKGSLRVTSGRGLTIEFHAARETPTDKGVRIELIAENTRFELGTLQRPFRAWNSWSPSWKSTKRAGAKPRSTRTPPAKSCRPENSPSTHTAGPPRSSPD